MEGLLDGGRNSSEWKWRAGPLLLTIRAGSTPRPVFISKLDEKDMNRLAVAISQSPPDSVEGISFFNWMRNDSLAMFCTIVLSVDAVSDRLRFLHFGSNKFSNEGVRTLAKVLSAMPNNTIQRISLSSCFSERCPSLTELVRVPTLVNLDLEFNWRLGSESIIRLCEGLRLNVNLKQLNITGCSVTDDGICELAKVLEQGHPLQVLYLRANEFGDRGLITLSEAIPRSQLLDVSIGSNRFGEEGMAHFIEMLPQMRTLQRLDLSFTQLPAGSVEKFSDAIHSLWKLHSLDLSHCFGVGNDAVNTLIDRGLATHLRMKTVTLESTPVSPANIQRLVDKLQRLHSKDSMILVSFCSVQMLKHVGIHSILKKLPIDLLRRVHQMLVHA